MNPFSTPKCPHCGKSISRDSRYCPHCGKAVGGAAVTRCGVCGAENPSDAEYCHNCGRPLRESQAPEIRRHRWARRDEEFAVRIDADDLPGKLKHGVIVEPGSNAMLVVRGENKGLLPPGEYTVSTIGQRIQDWITGGIPERATILLVDTVPVSMDFNLGGRFTKDPLPIGVTMRLSLEVSDPVKFLINRLHDSERITQEEVRQYLYPEVAQIADRWLRRHTLEELVEDPQQRALLELALDEELRPTLLQSGLRLLQVRTAELNLEPYDEIKGVRGKYSLVNAHALAELYGKRLAAGTEADTLQFELEHKLLLDKIQEEARQRWDDLKHEKNLHDLSEETRRVELEERKVDLYQRMRLAVLSDKMLEVRSEADFKKFMGGIEGEELLSEKEREELLRTWREEADDHQRARAHLLARLDIEQDYELRMLRLKLHHAQQAAEHVGDMAQMKALDERLDSEVQLARKRADWDFELRRKTVMEAAQLELDAIRIIQEREAIRREIERLNRERERADEFENARLGLEILKLMKANQRLDEEERLRIQRENKLIEARELWKLELEKLEFGERQRMAERTHELDRIKLFGQLGSEALISLSTPEQSRILADLKRTEILSGMSDEQILAMAAEKSPHVAEAFSEKYRAIANGQASQLEKELYERLLGEQKESFRQLREESDKRAAEVSAAWKNSADSTQTIATHAMDRMADVSKNQVYPPIIITPVGGGRRDADRKEDEPEEVKTIVIKPGGKTCQNCGRYVDAEEKYCRYCGTKFDGV